MNTSLAFLTSDRHPVGITEFRRAAIVRDRTPRDLVSTCKKLRRLATVHNLTLFERSFIARLTQEKRVSWRETVVLNHIFCRRCK